MFVCTLFFGGFPLKGRGALEPENPILPIFSTPFWVARAMCAEPESAVSTLMQVFLRNNTTPPFWTLCRPFDLPIVASWRTTTAVVPVVWTGSGENKLRLVVLLCHKLLARFEAGLSVMEILTRGGGLWVSNPKRSAANHGLSAMSRRSRRRWGTLIGRRRSDRIARDCCCRGIAKASSRWRRACSLDA